MKSEISKESKSDAIAVIVMAIIITAVMFLAAMCDPAYSQKVTQRIDLRQGYNMISSYVIPDDDSISHIFDMSKVDLIFSLDGVYWPQGEVYSLHLWDVNSAYKVKMKEASRICITGTLQSCDGHVTSLQPGINYMSVPCGKQHYFPDIFSDQIENVLFIINMNNMEIYSPELEELSNLKYLNPGHGYMVYMLQAAEVVW